MSDDVEMPEGYWYSHNRQEVYCSHGVGHPVPWSNAATHGCDGCCSDNPLFDEAVKAAKLQEQTEGDFK